jgi:hypothetical protein
MVIVSMADDAYESHLSKRRADRYFTLCQSSRGGGSISINQASARRYLNIRKALDDLGKGFFVDSGLI